MTVEGEGWNVNLKVMGEAGRIEIVGSGNSPTSIAGLRDRLDAMSSEDAWDGISIDLTLRRGFHARKANLGDLKSAYLAAFAEFGYFFAGAKAVQVVRKQLQTPETELLSHFAVPLPREERSNGLVLLRKPWPALLVAMNRGAFLFPFPGGVEDPYSLVEATASAGGKIRFEGTMRPWPTKLKCELDYRFGST